MLKIAHSAYFYFKFVDRKILFLQNSAYFKNILHFVQQNIS